MLPGPLTLIRMSYRASDQDDGGGVPTGPLGRALTSARCALHAEQRRPALSYVKAGIRETFTARLGA